MHGLAVFYDLYPLWTWLAVAALLLACETATGSGYLLWPAASAGVVGLLSVPLRLGAAEAIVLFAVLTVASTFLARRFLPPAVRTPSSDINDRAGRLIGLSGETVSLFVGGHGRVFVDGAEWAAELSPGQPTPEPGARVEVVEVLGGGRLKVRPAVG